MSDQNRSKVWNKAIVWIGKLYIWRWVLSLNAVYVHVRVRQVHIRKYTIALNSKLESIELSTLLLCTPFLGTGALFSEWHMFEILFQIIPYSKHATYLSNQCPHNISVSVQYICQLPSVLSREEIECKNGPKLT